ncbi:hypothetical protein SCLCIDRAFT_21392 [Scleroderma citrinum Foug A]|uniref:Uncharacterized protein n=1 Tax=Scleroderma citrinum Foug A TaxID=1036808 RepID=A0A0C3AQ38_9AGAM|nr:hypothetical protein SCLCIDRAFT_21392 [Scleroderma citrinum Foug A]
MSFDFQEADQTSSNDVPTHFGGDHPLGLPLIMELEAKGYIVITSVSSPEGVSAIERKSHGFIRDLVLDSNESGTIPILLRS